MTGEAEYPPSGGEEPDINSSGDGHEELGKQSARFPAPSDRTWIHPAELPGRRAVAPIPPAPRRWLQAALGSAAAILLIGGATLLVLAPPRSTESTAVLTSSSPATTPRGVQKISGSLVSLAITSKGSSPTTACGLVVNGGMAVATTATVPAGAAVVVETDTGTELHVSTIRTDPTIGLSVLSLPSPLPTGQVAQSPPATKVTAIAVAESSGTSQLRWASAASLPPTTAIKAGSLIIGAIESANALSEVSGSALVTDGGQVVAIAAPRLGSHAYLPSTLVSSLSRRLAEAPDPSHGWLEITGKTSPTGGAEVVSVAGSSPAAGWIGPGDVVVRAGHTDVRTMADLIDFLYSLPARALVTLHLVHDGSKKVVTVALTGRP